MEENLPPGFRFHPTDEELITHYLRPKVADVGFACRAVADVDLNKCEPWDLPARAIMGEKEWYFFSLRDRKYPTGLRTNRATEAGYWKTTGKDKEIFRVNVLVGMKKTLVFYRGRAPKGEKSNWVMHEYRLENKPSFKPTKEAEWVVCRVFQKSSNVKKPQQATSVSQPSLDSPCNTNSIVNEFGEDMDLLNLNHGVNSSHVNYDVSGSGGAQNHSQIDISDINMHTNTNMGMDMPTNWAGAVSGISPSLSWPSGLLGSNLSMNSLLLKALQLRTYQAMGQDYSSILPQGIGISSSVVGTDLSSNNFNFTGSSSKVFLDSMQELQQQQQHQDQPINLDWIPFGEVNQ